MLLLVVAAFSGCNRGGGKQTAAESSSSRSQPAVSIHSSLEGFATLPPRIRWSITTSLPPEQVRKVSFFVDREHWWADVVAPYTYGPQGAYLATRWLSLTGRTSRMHEFKVRVIDTNGDKWSESVRARTPEANVAHHAPGGFSAEYGRLSAVDLADPPPPGTWPSSYTGALNFIGASLFVRGYEDDHGFAWEMSSDSKRVYLGTPIFLGFPAVAGFAGFHQVEGVLCAPDGPPATYTWAETKGRLLSTYQGKSYYARYLQLRAVKDPCAKRRRLVEGFWDEITD